MRFKTGEHTGESNSKWRPLKVRFWEKVNKAGPTVRPELGPCWLWTGSQRGKEYGAVSYEGKMESAHRVAWFLETGEWPKPQACHKCDTKLCVRFTHLFEGTNKDNQHDKALKGRASTQQGEQCGAAKLTAIDVMYIRRYLQAGVTGIELARTYGVSTGTISHIKRGRIWRSV
jgi:hypothetical protein